MKKSIIVFLLFWFKLSFGFEVPEISGIYCNLKGIVLLFNIPGNIHVWSSDDKQLGFYYFKGLEEAENGKLTLYAISHTSFPNDTLVGWYEPQLDQVTIKQSRYWKGIYRPC